MRDYAKTGGKKGMAGLPDSASHGRRAYRTPSSFRAKVFKTVSLIPKGKTLTYKEVAEKAGKPRAWRAVGNILNKNCDPEIPCHRVIRADGKTGGYNRGVKNKMRLLKKEHAL